MFSNNNQMEKKKQITRYLSWQEHEHKRKDVNISHSNLLFCFSLMVLMTIQLRCKYYLSECTKCRSLLIVFETACVSITDIPWFLYPSENKNQRLQLTNEENLKAQLCALVWKKERMNERKKKKVYNKERWVGRKQHGEMIRQCKRNIHVLLLDGEKVLIAM